MINSKQKFIVSRKVVDDNGEVWYNMRIYSADIRKWLKSQNQRYWVKTETIIDYSINEQIYTLLALI